MPSALRTSSDACAGGGMLWVADTQAGGPLSVAGQRATFGTSNIAGRQASLEYFVLTTRPVARVVLTQTVLDMIAVYDLRAAEHSVTAAKH